MWCNCKVCFELIWKSQITYTRKGCYTQKNSESMRVRKHITHFQKLILFIWMWCFQWNKRFITHLNDVVRQWH